MPEDFFKVSELNRFIKDVLSAGFPRSLWVSGEIQQYDRNRNKPHVFFELVEKDPASQDVLARIGLVIFANRKAAIEEALLRNAEGFMLKDDIEVKFLCRVDFYSPRGEIRLIVENIDPFYTLGKIALERQKLITALKESGVLEQNKALEFPLVPLRIGLVTADDSAACNDFLSELAKSGFGFRVFLRNTIMQGKKAEDDVVSALDALEKIKDLDTIVITRGGGSLADLSCFDSRKIACRIAQARVPILSGIGHEINTTVTDLAAHTFAKTPTAIAHVCVLRVEQFLETIEDHLENIFRLAEEEMSLQLKRLKQDALRLQNATLQFLQDHSEQLMHYQETLKHRPGFLLKEQNTRVGHARAHLLRTLSVRLQRDKDRLRHNDHLISLLHPGRILKRGFSITRLKNGKILRSARDIRPGEELDTQLPDGVIASQVTRINAQPQSS